MALLAAGLSAGCATASSELPPDDGGASPEATTGTDGTVDPDALPPGDGSSMDAPMDSVRPPCHADVDCQGSPTPVCDLTTGQCVQCMAGSALRCPTGSYCTAGETCMPGCNSDTDCGGMADGGPQLTCNVMHQCIAPACRVDDDCAPGTLCAAGRCASGCTPAHMCPMGITCCAGTCVDVQHDASHCGGCAVTCSTMNATPTCGMGHCALTCATGYGDCDSDATNGCETDTRANAAHCGGCMTACSFAHSMGMCTAGACLVSACDAGYQDCDHNGANGCEAATLTDPLNCGRCGSACPGGMVCAAGLCACAAGQMICAGACTDVTSSTTNCGMCNVGCPAGQMCLGGHCSSNITTYSTATAVPPSVTWVEACALPGAVHELMGIDDGMGATVTMPFAFRFFDGTYTQVTPSADGYLGMGAAGTIWGTYGSFTLPATASVPRPAFFVFSVDLYQRAGGECFATVGTAPNRSFVWENSDAEKFADASTHLTFEVFLNEGSNTFDVLYQTLSGAGTSGDTTLVGMQNAAGTRAYTYEHNTAGTLRSGLRVRFSPNGG